MAIITLNNRSINRSDTASAGQKWTATSATASDFQAASAGNFQKCDDLTASATADYTLQVSSTNVVPESANHMIVSLNGVIQEPGSTGGFTVSGSTLSFTSALTSNDTIDFVILLGNVLDVGVCTDNTVSTAKIVDDAVTTAKIADDAVSTDQIANDAVSLAKMASGTDGNIISYDTSGNPVAVATGTDGQVLTSSGAGAVCAFETLPSGGITEIDQWQTSSSQSGSTAFDCGNWTRSWQTQLGTGMTESSGIFTFPSTGWWRLEAQGSFYKSSQSDWVSTIIYITTNTEGSWDYPSIGSSHTFDDSGSYSGSYCSFIFDVTNVSSHKCKLVLEAEQTTAWVGHATNINTAMKFTKLAET